MEYSEMFKKMKYFELTSDISVKNDQVTQEPKTTLTKTYFTPRDWVFEHIDILREKCAESIFDLYFTTIGKGVAVTRDEDTFDAYTGKVLSKSAAYQKALNKYKQVLDKNIKNLTELCEYLQSMNYEISDKLDCIEKAKQNLLDSLE